MVPGTKQGVMLATDKSAGYAIAATKTPGLGILHLAGTAQWCSDGSGRELALRTQKRDSGFDTYDCSREENIGTIH
jgi:hypothetical protein